MGKTVREHPAPDKNAVMDDDDQRDYEDYNYEPPQVHDGDGGSGDSDDLKAFLRVLVDSMELTSDELEEAVGSLSQPTSSSPDNGTTIQEAIAVCSRH